MSDYTIRALTPETFGDFAALVERNKGMFASCWCTHFHPDCAEKGQSAEGNRALKQRLVAAGIAHAALVYDGDRAIAWAEYGSPEELPSIHHRKEYLATAQRLPDYRTGQAGHLCPQPAIQMRPPRKEFLLWEPPGSA